MARRRRPSGAAEVKAPRRQRSPVASVRGRPPRLAHLLPGSPAQRRHARALAALLGVAASAAASSAVAEPRAPAMSEPDILCLPSPEWLPHRLTVIGPADDLAEFRAAARGPGRIAWTGDYEAAREDWTARLLAHCGARWDFPAESARGLARAMRELIETLDVQAADSGAEQGCPFDLNALVPMPAALLRRGPEDRDVLAWRWTHWGTTWLLRGVEELPAGRVGLLVPEGQEAMSLRFWSADWTPWRALAAVRARWPALALHVRVLAVAA